MTFRPAALVLATGTLLSAPAFGQDASAFAGAFAGAHVGIPNVGLDVQDDLDVDGNGVVNATDAAAASLIEGLDFDGLTYGAQVGYNFTLGSFVVGPELAVSGTTTEAEDPTGTLVGTTAVELVIDYTARASLRGGYAWDRNLFFGSVGAAYLKGGAETTLSETGTAYGLGYERSVSDRAVIGVQIMEQTFDDVEGTGLDIDLRTLEARYSYRF